MAVAQIVKWARPTYSGHAYSEIYRAASQLADTDTATVLAGATKKGETVSNVWADAEVSRGDTWWYYIRHVNTLGAAGAFTEKSATVEALGDLASQDTINDDDWSGADLAVANGGTGASTQAGARTNLGLGTMSTQAASAVAITGGSIAVSALSARTGASGEQVVLPLGTASIGGGLQVTTDGNLVWRLNALNSRTLVFQTNQTDRITIGPAGEITFHGLPTASPGGTGRLWNDSGTLKIT